jgi:tRNA (Thr-GGU) A37 N-methylase
MNYTDKHIVEAYSELLDGLSNSNKMELIEHLSKSLQKQETLKEDKFYKSFGAFASDKPATKIIAEIKSVRKFRNKEIRL